MLSELARANPKLFWTLLVIAYILVVEIIYLIFVSSKEYMKPKSKSWLGYTFEAKFFSLFFGFGAMMFIWIIIDCWKEVIVLLGIVAVIVIYFWINYLIAKSINNVRGKKRAKK